MKKRTLGRGGLDVSALGFGCMGLSFAYGPALEPGRGHRESSVRPSTMASRSSTRPKCMDRSRTKSSSARRWRPLRDHVVIATKFGFTFDAGKQSGLDSRPTHIREVAEASLKRLRTDRDRPLLPAPG